MGYLLHTYFELSTDSSSSFAAEKKAETCLRQLQTSPTIVTCMLFPHMLYRRQRLLKQRLRVEVAICLDVLGVVTAAVSLDTNRWRPPCSPYTISRDRPGKECSRAACARTPTRYPAHKAQQQNSPTMPAPSGGIAPRMTQNVKYLSSRLVRRHIESHHCCRT